MSSMLPCLCNNAVSSIRWKIIYDDCHITAIKLGEDFFNILIDIYDRSRDGTKCVLVGENNV